MRTIGIACLAAFALTACAGRPPQPVPLVLASDHQLDCSAIDAETRINAQRISDLAIEQGWKMGQNVAAGIIGFALWPAWLGLDLQNAAGQEAKALTERNAYLEALARERCRPAAQTVAASPAGPPLSPLASNAEISASLVSH